MADHPHLAVLTAALATDYGQQAAELARKTGLTVGEVQRQLDRMLRDGQATRRVAKMPGQRRIFWRLAQAQSEDTEAA